MSTLVLCANQAVSHCRGSECCYKLGRTHLKYSEGVQEVANKYQSYWFLDIIASYQCQLKNVEFQQWKLERDYSFTVINDIKHVHQRKNSFVVTCDDGNNNVLITQHIEFSDFEFDQYKVWIQNEMIYLPSEH